MILKFSIAAGCLLPALAWAAQAAKSDDSLYQKNKAQSLKPEQQAMFGPRSADYRYDPRMLRAAQIAQLRARPQMTWHCWKYVKDALLAADLVASRPTSAWAKDAGAELCGKFGFRKLSTSDPFKAPIGAVIVYGGPDAGHVELRTATGFVSDFSSPTPYPRPLVGIFVKSQ